MPPDGQTTPHDCARWQFEIGPSPGLAEQSCYWSDEKLCAYERIKTLLALGSISSHLMGGLVATGAFPISTHYGCAHCSIRVVGNKVRITISKFYYIDPDDPGPDGGHVCAPVQKLELAVVGSGRRYEILELQGKLSIPDYVVTNLDAINIKAIAAQFAEKTNCEGQDLVALIRALSGHVVFPNEGQAFVAAYSNRMLFSSEMLSKISEIEIFDQEIAQMRGFDPLQSITGHAGPETLS